MEEGQKGAVVGFLAVVATLFSIFCCYGLIYVWIREFIDHYIRGIKLTSTTHYNDDDSSLPRTRQSGNWFLLPLVLAFPLAILMCIARLTECNNILLALSWLVTLSLINYNYLSSFYVQSGKWLVSRGSKYYSQVAVEYIIGIPILVGGALVHSVEGHAIITALAVTIMSVIAYAWERDRSGITNGIGLGYMALRILRNDLWTREREAGWIVLFTFIFFLFALFTEDMDDHDHDQGKVANLHQSNTPKTMPV